MPNDEKKTKLLANKTRFVAFDLSLSVFRYYSISLLASFLFFLPFFLLLTFQAINNFSLDLRKLCRLSCLFELSLPTKRAKEELDDPTRQQGDDGENKPFYTIAAAAVPPIFHTFVMFKFINIRK